MNRRLPLVVSALLLSVGTAASFAGPLDPPAGPVAVTGRTAILSLPITISQPGSYYLARDFSTAASVAQITGAAITVAANDVTIDLNGFSIYKPATASTRVAVSMGASNGVTVKNGHLIQWSQGVVGTGNECRVEDVVVSAANPASSSPWAIQMGERGVVRRSEVFGAVRLGNQTLVESCHFKSNEGGTVFADQCVVRDCSFSNIGSPGFPLLSVGSRCTVSNSVFGDEVDSPVMLSAGANCVITGCSVVSVLAHSNLVGISVGSGARVEGCNVSLTTSAARCISSGIGSKLTDCTVSGALKGIVLNEQSQAIGCKASGVAGNGFETAFWCTLTNCYSSLNTGIGYLGGAFCSIDGCVGTSNGLDGFQVGGSSALNNCKAMNNKGDGFRIADRTSAVNCVAVWNGALAGAGGNGAGIHAVSLGNRIEGCTVTSNDRGIEVSVSGNTIVRNNARLNTSQYPIAAGNDVGPITTAAAMVSPVGNIQD